MQEQSLQMEKVTLFLSGLFFGGVIDHVVLGLAGSKLTPFGIDVGVLGNWLSQRLMPV